MSALAEGGCPKLRQMSLRSNELGPAGLAHLVAGLQQGCLGRLEILDLAVNGLSDEPASALLPLLFSPLVPSLKEVDMTFNGLDAHRASLQLAALRSSSSSSSSSSSPSPSSSASGAKLASPPARGPIVQLERRSQVPIIRRTQTVVVQEAAAGGAGNV